MLIFVCIWKCISFPWQVCYDYCSTSTNVYIYITLNPFFLLYVAVAKQNCNGISFHQEITRYWRMFSKDSAFFFFSIFYNLVHLWVSIFSTALKLFQIWDAVVNINGCTTQLEIEMFYRKQFIYKDIKTKKLTFACVFLMLSISEYFWQNLAA